MDAGGSPDHAARWGILAEHRIRGHAGQGESNIRRWLIENDWLEAIVALPLNMFYNTGIATYVWVLTNRKPAHQNRTPVGLVDLVQQFARFQAGCADVGVQFPAHLSRHLRNSVHAHDVLLA